jgi:hypothetical protein
LRSANTLSLAQELGFTYHIDDISRDEPFVIPVNGKPFAVVPYTSHLGDIGYFNNRGMASVFAQDLKLEFDALYAEAEHKRRLMVVSCTTPSPAPIASRCSRIRRLRPAPARRLVRALRRTGKVGAGEPGLDQAESCDLSLSAAWLGAARGGRAAGVVGPRMAWIAASHLGFDRGIAAAPEARQIARHLDRPMRR